MIRSLRANGACVSNVRLVAPTGPCRLTGEGR